MSKNTRSMTLDRRAAFCGGGALAVGTLLASLPGGARPARAQALAAEVPAVDRVAVRVVVDSYQVAVAPSARAGTVEINRFGWPLGSQPPAKALVSEFGLSMHVHSHSGAVSRRVLVDFGYTPEALNTNAEILGIDPAALDALVLSHGHYDHFGGLLGFIDVNRGKLRRDLPLYVGGEECFCARQWTAPPLAGDFGVLDRPAFESSAIRVTIAEGPVLVADHGFISGQVPQATFERVLSPSRMTVGVRQGLGCYPEAMPEGERQPGAVIPDQFRHEIATVYNLRGRGLVVLTSCSHRGVINIIKRAQEVSGIRKIHAVLGGFHLAPYPAEYVGNVVASLKEIDPDYIIPMHCTGEAFWDMGRQAMPGKLLRAYTGTEFVFTS